MSMGRDKYTDIDKEAKSTFRKELALFRKRLPEFMEKHPGEYVLIKGNKVTGFFRTEVAAVKTGYRVFGPVPFLVKQVKATEEIYTLTPIRFKKK